MFFIIYFILIIAAILFKVMHWPGGSLFLIISPFLPLADLLIQAIRIRTDKIVRILSSLALLGLSLFLPFVLLSWEGATFVYLAGLVLAAPYFVWFFLRKCKRNIRFYLLVFLVLFSTVHVLMKKSTVVTMYLTENPFSETSHVPVFVMQRLAFYYYEEGDHEKAEKLLEKSVIRTKNMLKHPETYPEEFTPIYQDNLQQLKLDYKAVQENKWDKLDPVFPEEFYIPAEK